MIQPVPVGWWQQSIVHEALWAIEQIRIEKQVSKPERKPLKAATRRIQTALTAPVIAFDWAKWAVATADVPIYKDTSFSDGPPVPLQIQYEWQNRLPGVVASIWAGAGKLRTKQLGLPFPKEAMDQALALTFQEVAGISETMVAILQRAMAIALENQVEQFEFARNIRREWRAFAGARANLIAVTEWNRAASAATYFSYKAQGVETLMWFTVGDERVCSTCEDNAGEGEVPINQGFSSGDLYPPAHPGCRCNVAGGYGTTT